MNASQRSHRNFISWFFILLLIIYLIYSSNFIFNNNNDDCSSNISINEDDHLSTNNASTITLQEEEEEEERKKEYNYVMKKDETELKHIVFGVAASSNLWDKRKQYIKLWWRPGETRGVVWLDENVKTNKNEPLPDIRISGDHTFCFSLSEAAFLCL